MALDLSAMATIIGNITYKPGWTISLKKEPTSDRPYLQIAVTEKAEAALDCVTGERNPWTGAKHYLSPHMCRHGFFLCLNHPVTNPVTLDFRSFSESGIFPNVFKCLQILLFWNRVRPRVPRISEILIFDVTKNREAHQMMHEPDGPAQKWAI